MPPVFGVLFDGLAYGMLLFLLSVGLSVTLGMMNFVNLAHCSFAMLGGYVAVTLMNALGWPFLVDLAGRIRSRGRGQRRARTRALSPPLSRQRSRPVPAHDRRRVRLDRGRRLYLRHRSAAAAVAGRICAARSSFAGLEFRGVSGCS